MAGPKAFKDWLPGYLDFRSRAARVLSQRLPSDIGALQAESQDLEPLKWEAEEARAMAETYYYAAKAKEAERLAGMGFSKSVAWEAAKANCHRELWARVNTQGLCKTIDSRSMKVAQHLKLLAPT